MLFTYKNFVVANEMINVHDALFNGLQFNHVNYTAILELKNSHQKKVQKFLFLHVVEMKISQFNLPFCSYNVLTDCELSMGNPYQSIARIQEDIGIDLSKYTVKGGDKLIQCILHFKSCDILKITGSTLLYEENELNENDPLSLSLIHI